MSVSVEDIGNGFSREAVRKAVAEEPISDSRKVQLNELAAQVAEQFAAGSVSPRVLARMVALFEFLAISCAGIGLFLCRSGAQQTILG